MDGAQYIDVVMPYYTLIKNSDNYSKMYGILFQYCKDVPTVDNNSQVTDFTEANVIDSFILKEKLTGQTGDNGPKYAEITVP